MADELRCYRCGASLESLTPPISRQDMCPSCSNYLHVCRMCVHFDADVARQCREDDAEDVTEKEKLNFCDYFVPSATAFDADRKTADDQARDALASLFGDGDGNGEEPPADDAASAAEDLFK